MFIKFKINWNALMKSSSSLVLALFLSLTLGACGGGGGGSSTPTPTPTPTPLSYIFPLNSAWVDSIKIASNQSFVLSGSTNTYAVTGSGTITNTALSSTWVVFNGAPGYSATESLTGTAFVNGVTVPLSNSDTNYYDALYRPLGSTGDTNLLVTGSANVPLGVKIGDSGTIYTGKTYSSSSFTTQIGTQTLTYAIAADPSSSVHALVTTTYVNKDLTGLVTSTTNNLIRMHYDGTAKRISTTSISGNTTLISTFPS